MADATQTSSNVFPFPGNDERLAGYSYYEQLLAGNHYAAYSIEAGKDFAERYARLRYIACNFAGLVSKVIADILFGEEIQIKSKNNQDFLDAFYAENEMRVLNYESAISNSARGDAVFRLSIKDNGILLDTINPAYYFPTLNVAGQVSTETLAWKKQVGDSWYLIQEIYNPGTIEVKINKLEGKNFSELGEGYDVNAFNLMAGTNYQALTLTGVSENLLVHIPNYRQGSYFGVSDYNDITSLMYALNNRITKIDNILDKHSDPILAVPSGVLDENGQVKKESFNLFELTDDGQKPEYIVWNANLENAFTEIEKLVDLMFMFSETSPDIVGRGTGTAAESGRALKMRLIRTIAKRNRKRLYYELGLQQIFWIAQELSRVNGYNVGGETATGESEYPTIVWSDGIVNDQTEDVQNTVAMVEAGLESQKRAIMALQGVSDAEATAIIQEIKDEKGGTKPFDPFAAYGGPGKNAATTGTDGGMQSAQTGMTPQQQPGMMQNNAGN